MNKQDLVAALKEALCENKCSEGKGMPVLVTTTHRGVFFGYSEDTSGDTIKLTNGRNVLYWSADVKGFIGLAVTGPTSSCRVGPKANIEVRNVTSVTEVTQAAALAFETAPWAK